MCMLLGLFVVPSLRLEIPICRFVLVLVFQYYAVLQRSHVPSSLDGGVTWLRFQVVIHGEDRIVAYSIFTLIRPLELTDAVKCKSSARER